MIARQFRGFTVAACLMVLAAFGMPDTSWAWESDGPRFNIYTQGYEKADVDEGGSYSKTETGVSAGYKWFTLAYKRSDFSCCLLYTSPSPRDGLLSRMPSSA